MGRLDARKLPRHELLALRLEVVRLRQQGVPVMQIVDSTGLSWSAVNAALRCFKDGGESALMPAARGRKLGTGRKLTPVQEVELRRLIRRDSPKRQALKDILWSRGTVLRLLASRFDVQLTEHGIGRYLNSWGIKVEGAEKRRPMDRCSAPVREWLSLHYASLHEQITRERAEVYWLNKPYRLDPKIWSSPDARAAPKGRASRKQLTLVSVVDSQGKLLWRVITGTFNADQQAKFAQNLVAVSGRRPTYLIKFAMKRYSTDGAKIRVLPDTSDDTAETTEQRSSRRPSAPKDRDHEAWGSPEDDYSNLGGFDEFRD